MSDAFVAKIQSFKGDQEAIDAYIWSQHQNFMLNNHGIIISDRKKRDPPSVQEIEKKIKTLDEKMENLIMERAKLVTLLQERQNNL
jgi:hypothetical protein